MKTAQQFVKIAQESRRVQICAICGAKKKATYAFCVRCYFQLPQGKKSALNFGSLSDYLRAYVDCYRYLRTEEEQAATKLVEELTEQEPFRFRKMFDLSIDEPMEGVPDLDAE